ncbi:unnamed protein product [Fraxinus pennsylvanica]|uniref:Glutaredoxin domain-containing protein n=1 Tax=Fraxinus pennsylvanica TaxID=56036 RepID=A0AAD2DLJ8_9LAMI|nr:unnamed protein product [Fraxinus pennsylvanica]
MGSSASRPHTFIGQQQNPSSNSYSSSTPVSRTLSLPTPLVHHPPLCQGDSDHFVSLTSTTHGSIVVIDSPNINFTQQDFENSEDPLSPDSVINTWELMGGLDDDDFHIIDFPKTPRNTEMDASDIVKSFEFVEHGESKPFRRHLSEESLLAKMDSNVVSSYRNALLARQHGQAKIEALETNNGSSPVSSSTESCSLSGAEDRIVLYYTTLRGIRKTFEDCCAVRLIFRGFNVCLDERDLSMDLSYRNELKDALKGKAISLPQVFVRGQYIGGAEEIKELNESGALAKLVEGFPLMDLGFVCDSCGDARFVPCPNCNGSRKVYEDEEGELMRCSNCNENVSLGTVKEFARYAAAHLLGSMEELALSSQALSVEAFMSANPRFKMIPPRIQWQFQFSYILTLLKMQWNLVPIIIKYQIRNIYGF